VLRLEKLMLMSDERLRWGDRKLKMNADTCGFDSGRSADGSIFNEQNRNCTYL
jgi:hypothetical protein